MSYNNAVSGFNPVMNNQRLWLLQGAKWTADQDKKKMQVNIPNSDIPKFHTPLTSSELICLMKDEVGRASLEILKPQKTDQDNWFIAEVGVEQNDGSLRVSIGMGLFNAIKNEMSFNCEVPSKVEMPSKVKTSSVMARNHAPSPDCEEASGHCHH